MAGADVAVPLHVSSALPDCVVRADAFDRGMQRAWRAGERFRMFFAGKGHWRAGALPRCRGIVSAQHRKLCFRELSPALSMSLREQPSTRSRQTYM